MIIESIYIFVIVVLLIILYLMFNKMKESSGNIAEALSVKDWYVNSKYILDKMYASQKKSDKEEELRKRDILSKNFQGTSRSEKCVISKSYSVLGYNQDQQKSVYRGFLYLDIISKNRVSAEWVIGGEQVQQGFGFYNEDILTINFFYKGDTEKVYKGVVVYKIIGKDILHGMWSEKHGDDKFLGVEECRRLEDSESIFKAMPWN